MVVEFVLVTGLRVLIGIILVVAGLAKARDIEHFVQTALVFTNILPSLTRWIARLLPSLEAILGILSILGLVVKPALAMSTVLLTVFTVGIAVNLILGRQVACGCFGGSLHEPVDIRALLRDVILVLGCGITFVLENGTWTLDRLLSGTVDVQFLPQSSLVWFTTVLIVLGGLVIIHLFSLVSRWDFNTGLPAK